MEKEDRGTEKGKKIKSILLVCCGIKVIPRYPSKDKESKNTGGRGKGWNKSPSQEKDCLVYRYLGMYTNYYYYIKILSITPRISQKRHLDWQA
jgi:hypothetical protein